MKILTRIASVAAMSSMLLAVPLSAQTQPTMPSGAPGADPSQVYVLGPGDQIRITVFGEDRLSGTFVITTSGELSFPLIGNLAVTGKTAAEVQAMVRERLAAGYVKDPRVSADMLSFRPYYVLGEVARPGQYPFVNGLTLQQAIATAGGYSYRAKKSKIYVKPANKPEEVAVDTKKQTGVLVSPGDTIRIGERFF